VEGTFTAANAQYNGGALPAWITWTDSGVSAQNVVFAPTDGTAVGTHTITVIFDSISGPNPSYTAFTVTVTCEVLSITQPSPLAASTEYLVYDATTTIDYTNEAYVQVPNCMYAYTSTFTWEGPELTAAITTNNAALNIYTTDRT
jgi:hypothetical protein